MANEQTPIETPAAPTEQPAAQAPAPTKHTLNNFTELLASRLAEAGKEEAGKGAAPATADAPPQEPAGGQKADEAVEGAGDEKGAQEPAEAQEQGTEDGQDEGAKKDEETPEPEMVDGVPKELAELAKKHGFVLKGGKVELKERVEFREAKRRQSKAIADREAALKTEQEQFIANHQEPLELGRAVMTAMAAKDWDALAKIGKYEDWNDLQKDVAESYADPHYIETRDMKRQLEEMRVATEKSERQKKEAEEAAKQQAQLQQQQQAILQYKINLGKQMAESSDPLAKALADDQRFVEDVFALQQENWSSKTQTTIELEEACKVLKANHPVWKRLHKILSAEQKAAAQSETITKKPVKASKAKTTPTPAPETPVRKRQSEMTPAETSRYFQERLKSGSS
jgi:hypothetical protein